MKIFVVSIIFALTIGFAFSAQAQLTVYDDFSGPFVDTGRWYHRNPISPVDNDIWSYEGGFRILKGKLNYFHRAYGADLDTDATQNMRRQLFLRNATDVTGIETSIQMVKNGHEITGCAANPVPSETRISMGGAFFNDGSSPGPGDFTGDILAHMGFFKYSDLGTLPPGNIAIPPGYMGVRARVYRCTNATCTTSDIIKEELFDNLLVKLGKKTMFRITLDKGSDTFTFQVGKKVSKTYLYTGVIVSDSAAPIQKNIRLEVAHYLANCPSPAAKTVGWADVLFDYVLTD
jgi:hypothetical protein